MRPFDLLLALPSLLLMLLLASIAPPTASMLVLIVALVNLPDIARIVRAAALEVAHRPAVEAMWLQGEGWWRIKIGYIGRSILRRSQPTPECGSSARSTWWPPRVSSASAQARKRATGR